MYAPKHIGAHIIWLLRCIKSLPYGGLCIVFFMTLTPQVD
jgi:hypothetical protein